MGQEDAVYLAKLAEQAERYEGTFFAPRFSLPRHPRVDNVL